MTIQIESKRLLIEERNRIAEELHDCVSQHLFGIIYAIHSMKCGWKDMTEEQKLEQMKEIQEAASSASGELRATIHSLSSSKSGKASWIGIIKSHLANQAKLNGISIDFQAPKSCSLLSINHQKALYRIILEGVGNAIRHGESSCVHVELTLKQDAVKLMIEDNGVGFDVRSKMNKTNSGFGLCNMHALAVSLGGTFDIVSKEGFGTRILLWLPLADVVNANEATSQNTKSG
ncbi:sensor histidine kinase [Paenibacillus spongiae]|uniref:Oxygen sensor histidine kinase NreB n=1 Tax=Paenibacillus spongiae TaxID=2909671 RepID=A0ABY5S5E5_9BACL|nr:sensor histidine kinase [Paenibacillus spongiae]UVI29132.1 sensor histidine kinase [Paenibacillus spongiae]